MKLTKYLPNIISIIRIAGSIALIFLQPLALPFLIVYAFCGLSDVMDGAIARKFNCATSTGALIDSLADAIFIFATIISIAPVLHWRWWIIVWIGVIFLIRVSSLILGIIKYHAFAFLHTYLNKASGFLVFCFPLLYVVLSFPISASIVCAFTSVSAIEELIINICSNKLDRDVKSIFAIHK